LGGAKHLGYSVAGFLHHERDHDPRVLGTFDDFPEVVRAHFIDAVFITIPSQRETVKAITLQAASHGVDVMLVPEKFDLAAESLPLGHIGPLPVIALHLEKRPTLSLLIKRAIDIVGSIFGLVFLAPLFALIAIAVKLDSPGPVFYCAPRLGRKGRSFTFYKFRSMVDDADRLKDELRQLNERQGPTFKITNDPRVTRVGKFLRRASLDELPQFLNVLLGDMSLVGPRPHPLDDCEQYTLDHLRRLEVTPGLTGMWQVEGRKDVSFEKNLALDMHYIDNWSLWMDIKLLVRTVPAVLTGSGE
jgi:exopolysaccharide biosynthesis polyprenyl glycosylphosphotransferase